MKEQCQKIRNMILEGSKSADVMEHMNTCNECRMLAESMVFFKEHSLSPEEKDVPAHLDASIKLAARQKLKTQGSSRTMRIFFEVGSLAAMVIFAMVILLQQQDEPSQNTPSAPVEQTVAAETKPVDAFTVSIEHDLDRMHSELADISDDLNNCSTTDDAPSLTDIFNISQLELDYAMYQANY